MNDPTQSRTEHGVRELISRLEDEGVEAGRRQAAAIVSDAERRAAQILAQAQREVDALRETAGRESAAQTQAMHEALRLACRDTLHLLKEEVGEIFGHRLRQHVTTALADPALLTELLAGCLRVMTHDWAAASASVYITGTREPHTVDFAASTPRLDELAPALLRQLTGDGMSLGERAIRIELHGQDLEIELGAERLSEMLLYLLSPRLRALLDGLPQAE